MANHYVPKGFRRIEKIKVSEGLQSCLQKTECVALLRSCHPTGGRQTNPRPCHAEAGKRAHPCQQKNISPPVPSVGTYESWAALILPLAPVIPVVDTTPSKGSKSEVGSSQSFMQSRNWNSTERHSPALKLLTCFNYLYTARVNQKEATIPCTENRCGEIYLS